MRNFKEIMSSRYLDLTMDAGFKAVFCNPKNLHILIDLVNSFLPEDRKVVEFHFADREIEGLSVDNKHVVLDLHCKDEQGRDFIVEMQKVTKPSFYLRTLYYATRIFNSNLPLGDKYFKSLKPVYLIALICEPLKEPEFAGLDDMVLWYCMSEKTKKSFAPDGINLIFADISKAAKNFTDCKGTSEIFCHIIREIGTSESAPEEFGEGVFADLAKASAVANIGIDKLKQYESEIMNELDYKAWLYESREEGREEGISTVAKSMLEDGVALETISKYSGLSIEELRRLQTT